MLIVRVEMARARPDRHQQSARPAAELERRDQGGQPAQIGHVGLKVVEPRLFIRHPATHDRFGALARGGDDLEL